MKGPRNLLLSLLAVFTLIPTVFAVSGDLALPETNVSFSNEYFLEGNSVRVWASVKNNSEYDLLGSVRYATQYGNIGGDQPISALAGNTDDVFIDWIPATFGEYTLTITVIPWDSSNDNPNNNVVVKTVFVQQDTDHDGSPNSSDQDDDNDGVLDTEDDFPLNSAEAIDSDGDGTGNNEDDDDDNDGILDADDAFPENPNFATDQDGDGIADEEDDDLDGDGLNTEEEELLGTNSSLSDTDEDGVIDGNDPFPTDSSEWEDTDSDGIGNNSDDDIDGDGIENNSDIAPYDSAPKALTDRTVYLSSINEEISFDASASKDKDGKIVEYRWQFGEVIETGATIRHSFDTKGMQTAILTVVDNFGQTDSLEVKIRVLDYTFLFWSLLLALLLLLLAFYLISRYNRRASSQEKKKSTRKSTKKK